MTTCHALPASLIQWALEAKRLIWQLNCWPIPLLVYSNPVGWAFSICPIISFATQPEWLGKRLVIHPLQRCREPAKKARWPARNNAHRHSTSRLSTVHDVCAPCCHLLLSVACCPAHRTCRLQESNAASRTVVRRQWFVSVITKNIDIALAQTRGRYQRAWKA